MERKELYERTVNILVQAYFNDTLKHVNCAACAVGNMVAANMGYTYGEKYGSLNWVEVDAFNEIGSAVNWFAVIGYGRNGNEQQFKEISATGYSKSELAEIEFAFEKAPKGTSDDEWMFNGLMSVIETLDIIHHNTDTSITTTSKGRFNKQLVTT